MRPENKAMNATMLTTLKKSAMGVVWIRSYKQEVNKRRMPLTEDQLPDGERARRGNTGRVVVN
jgi:hypothetical protein